MTARTAHVLMFCPVRTDRDIFELVAKSHYNAVAHADQNGVEVTPVYFDDTDAQFVGEVVPSCLLCLIPDLPDNKAKYEGHNWAATGTTRIASIRNAAACMTTHGRVARVDVTEGTQHEFTHLFMVDADLVLQPETITNLVAQCVPAVSEVFWSKWQEHDPWLPNVWMANPYRFHTAEHITQLREPGIYEVGGLGACTLIHKSVFQAGACYDDIPGYDMWGEDRHFSMRCAAMGVQLRASTHNPPFHIYRREMLDEAEQWYADNTYPEVGSNEKSVNPLPGVTASALFYRVSNGSATRYFRQRWLTDGWVDSINKSLAQAPVHGQKPETIFMALPGEKFDALWVNHLCTIQHTFERVLGHNILPFFGYSSDVRVTRNALWMNLKRQPVKPDWIVWIDDDNYVEPTVVYKLIAHLVANPDAAMAAGWCWCAADGYAMEATTSFGYLNLDGFSEPIKYPAMQTWPGDVNYVDYTGFPIVVMRGSLLHDERMPRLPFLGVPNDKLTYGMPGEDFAFCINVTSRTGQRILVDRSCKVPHLKTQHAEPLDFKAGMAAIPVSVQELTPKNA